MFVIFDIYNITGNTFLKGSMVGFCGGISWISYSFLTWKFTFKNWVVVREIPNYLYKMNKMTFQVKETFNCSEQTYKKVEKVGMIYIIVVSVLFYGLIFGVQFVNELRFPYLISLVLFAMQPIIIGAMMISTLCRLGSLGRVEPNLLTVNWNVMFLFALALVMICIP